jgi:Predicted N-acetylglucosaminyl transferase
VYWNGEQSIKEGDRQLKQSVKDDYSKVLPVYNYGTKTDGMKINSQMDRAIEKSSICVQKHSMKFGGKERVKWIDDSYLVMAKGHFYKQDYIAARRTFDFVATEYSYNDISQTANLWLIKTYIQTKQYAKAIALMEILQTKTASMPKLPKELRQNMDLVFADYCIASNNYDKAVKYLKNGILETNSRDLRTRAMFILGQIYQYQGDNARATEQYNKVIKRNPVYEMTFESRMNLAKVCSSGDMKNLYKMFAKMIADKKNEDYLDRIYFAMAEVSLREGNEDNAIAYLKKSVSSFKDNRIQQANSSLKLATMLFERNDYENAQAYYDTAVNAMNKDLNPEYDSVMNIAQTLNALVENIMIVRNQDSLLRVAAMDSITRNQFIDKIIADYKAEEQRLAEQRLYEEQLAMMGVGSPSSSVTDPGTGGGWYFYNSTSLSRGYTEFSKKWGMRKLEDNWRISDKQSIALAADGDMTDSEEGEISEKDSLSVSFGPYDRGYYMQDLPLTDEKKAESHKSIAEALNNLGFLYMNNLDNYPRSIESYQALNKRYPENEHELSSWYAMYKMFDELKNVEEADRYKNMILTKYADSDYAQVIMDPDFFKKMEAKEHEGSDFYAKTYDAYQNGQYFRVKMNAERAAELYAADTVLMPRFAFLQAVSKGRLETVDSMAYALYDMVKEYPNSSVTPLATDILRQVNEEYGLGIDLNDLQKEGEDGAEPKKQSPFIHEPSLAHYVIIVCNTKSVRIDPLKVRIADFNKKQYSIKNFNLRSIILDNQSTLVTIGNFDNEQQAIDYVTSLFLTDYVFGGIDAKNFSVYPISMKNYPVFYQNKDLEQYREFWEEVNK